MDPTRVCVIISYWSERNPHNLLQLLSQMRRYSAGIPYSTTLVCNGGNSKPPAIPGTLKNSFKKIITRENTGYNLGAWECGWRAEDRSIDYFLFLQDECFILRDNWLRAFVDKIQKRRSIGVLGESWGWDVSWEEAGSRALQYPDCFEKTADGKCISSFDIALRWLKEKNLCVPKYADHLQSLILFVGRRLLEEIDGFLPLSSKKHEAIASEIFFSKKVQALGYRIAQVHRRQFYYIGHPQWTAHPGQSLVKSVVENLRRPLARIERGRNYFSNRNI